MLRIVNPMRGAYVSICFFNGIIYLLLAICLLITYNKEHDELYIKNNENDWKTSIILFFLIGIIGFIGSFISCNYKKNSHNSIYE
jgi:hypothetical protein